MAKRSIWSRLSGLALRFPERVFWFVAVVRGKKSDQSSDWPENDGPVNLLWKGPNHRNNSDSGLDSKGLSRPIELLNC